MAGDGDVLILCIVPKCQVREDSLFLLDWQSLISDPLAPKIRPRTRPNQPDSLCSAGYTKDANANANEPYYFYYVIRSSFGNEDKDVRAVVETLWIYACTYHVKVRTRASGMI